MTGQFVLDILRNDLLNVNAKGGRISLSPRSRVTPRHRELVRKHRQELLLALAAWPNGEAPARTRAPWEEPPRPDELGREHISRPQVVRGRRWRR